MQRVALPDRHQAVEGAQRGGAREQLDAGLARPLGQLARVLVAALGEQPAARLGSLVAEHDVGALLGRGHRGAQPGGAAADDQHVGVAAAVLGPPLALGLAACAIRPRPAAWRSTFS